MYPVELLYNTVANIHTFNTPWRRRRSSSFRKTMDERVASSERMSQLYIAELKVQHTPPSIKTVSPLTNQLLTRNRTNAPMSVRDPAVTGAEPSSGGGWPHGTWNLMAEKLLKLESPSTFVDPGAPISVRKRPGRVHSVFVREHGRLKEEARTNQERFR